MRIIISLIIFCSAANAYPQSPQKIEQELLITFKRLQHWSLHPDASSMIGRMDSVREANTAFRNSLLAWTASVRTTFTCEFKDLEKEGLVIKTAEDGLFRIYSWNTGMGGAEPDYDAVFQYRVDNEVFSQLAEHNQQDAGKWYSNVYTLKTDNKTYYLGVYNQSHSSTSFSQGVKGFCIDDKDLDEWVRLFKTGDGPVNEMGFNYNFLTVAHRPERPAKLIYYDTDDDRLHLTVVQDDGKVTREIVTWQFTGKYFEQVKNR
ncbi:hypothetical protein [Niastella populi]|uniref:Uncharacterized protein n=1 Tax=Niastella populi TaxID=550983 RepID=A0A1V9GCX0_9BACT|nr:hypothetical protein [Niastella populi]OQP68525.1 hypothetical protein A4R26_01600 [Niastella populi]